MRFLLFMTFMVAGGGALALWALVLGLIEGAAEGGGGSAALAALLTVVAVAAFLIRERIARADREAG